MNGDDFGREQRSLTNDVSSMRTRGGESVMILVSRWRRNCHFPWSDDSLMTFVEAAGAELNCA